MYFVEKTSVIMNLENINPILTKIIHIPRHEILALVEHTITQLSEDDAIEFVMDLQEKISEMLPL